MSETNAPGDLALVQALVNTLDVESGEDLLTSPGGLKAFSHEHGLRLAAPELPLVQELREALRAACLAHTGTDAPAERLATLERLLTAAPLVLRIDHTGAATLSPDAALSGVPALTARLATAIVTGEADGSWRRLKACEAHDCQWAYYDRSPAGRRRWCSMQVCGSRAKMRAYRAKHRKG
ncbi:CGNR zinc finger domain-containing protein [Streptomyces gobiensis]|uniref:CGNR zinc finger domain-containing protein n=1 Tax=Streptomyces gobiensis TaxID=2875706 RepID=UPI001E347235|nr:CGNR zinc finger domain-containing protein [Streptomyces gobiensis]UGY91768.1 CGNR zinc finger domain-containing protein [Streptomyces gobiensis]